MRTFSVLIATAAAIFFSPLQAQDAPTPDGQQPGIAGFWEVVTSSGRFVARLGDITSVTQHEYIIDGAVRVFECTVDTRGQQTARFYYIEPVSASSSITAGSATIDRITSIANKVGEKTGHGDVDSNVTKHYPDTTHAKTSEFRLQNKATIGQIYDHARRVWAEEKGRGGQNMLIIRGG
ncbi:hypothetical protein N9B73_07205 [Verrucomicrobiales bacterium]|nr:hypothetical protein [Verrucomicrobiales bacterium]